MTELLRQDFDFVLPPELIAQHPAMPRENARLLRVQGEDIFDNYIYDLPNLLQAGDLLVANNTRVIPARLHGYRGEMRVEILLHQAIGNGVWQVFARPAKRLRVGEIVVFAPDFNATVQEKLADGQIIVDFSCSDAELNQQVTRHGLMPLPPYIKRDTTGHASDQHDYQTIFAAQAGAVAAPTAGLHFTPDLLAAFAAKGIELATVTLHVGAGTFQPVKAERLADHIMHYEAGEITSVTAAQINQARAAGRRIIAIGTTALRALETAHDQAGQTQAFCGNTNLFLYPGKEIRSVAGLITNFHLPQSTLFMLVCAFTGTATMRRAYHHAIAQHYRFYSYGDACLLLPNR